MTKKVITLKEKDTLKTAVERFAKYGISGIPVVRGERPVGIVTEADIIKTIDAYSPEVHYDSEGAFAVILAVLRHKKGIEGIRKDVVGSKEMHVKDFMTKKVIPIGPEKTVMEAANLMHKNNVIRLPVVKGGKLVGIIARGDIIRALGKKK
ncbi:MAG: CBS domain-containing protein [Candidatus Aenigmarchaeota archaeon]|nr:CBS domain-containing protein [Candidatus Aenigmarchaeota archaeon]